MNDPPRFVIDSAPELQRWQFRANKKPRSPTIRLFVPNQKSQGIDVDVSLVLSKHGETFRNRALQEDIGKLHDVSPSLLEAKSENPLDLGMFHWDPARRQLQIHGIETATSRRLRCGR